MTAEIAVMNSSAVALAADSAATLEMQRGHKIYMVNKLFMLSRFHPVGIMIYGKPRLLGVPWETVIKTYEEHLGKKKFGTLEEYSNNLINFIERASILSPEEIQNEHVRECLLMYYTLINEEVVTDVESYTKEKKITKLKIKEITNNVINKHCKLLEERDKLKNISNAWISKLLDKYASTIKQVKKEVFVKLPISAAASRNLKKLAGYLFSRDLFREDLSGVVIAGFGNDEIFPNLKSFEIECVINGKAKYKISKKVVVAQDNNACIVPFAQEDMVREFMEGVHPDYLNYLFKGLRSLLMQKYPDKILAEIKEMSKKKQKEVALKLEQINMGILDEFQQQLDMHSKTKHIGPVVMATSHLPKGELAEMAETLVSLISFKKRMSVDAAETVGGPIDVAVISKADGFIWIKRKCYFNQELNQYLNSSYY